MVSSQYVNDAENGGGNGTGVGNGDNGNDDMGDVEQQGEDQSTNVGSDVNDAGRGDMMDDVDANIGSEVAGN